jgi:L-threonylcarbamoyladenylate synthase
MHQKSIEEAKKRLFRGELVIFPTETVYGIGGNANNHKSIEQIYKTKNRPISNPLICHFANIREIEKNFILTDKDYELANTFWPGPLTLILEKNKSSMISPLLSNNKKHVGCRIPNNEIILSLLSILDFPIAAPSANIATRTSVTSIKDLDYKLKEIFYIDGGSSVLGLESTVIKTTDNGCKILRLGSLTIEDIKIKFPKYEISIEQSNVSPGNQLKHYSPIKPIRINVDFVKKK